MSRFFSIGILCISSVFLYSWNLYAWEGGPWPLEVLVEDSDIVILAKVTKIKSYYRYVTNLEERKTLAGSNRYIVSDITLEPIEIYQGQERLGNGRRQLVFEQPGGCLVEECFTTTLYPTTFRAGENAVFFLTYKNNDHDRLEGFTYGNGFFKIGVNGLIDHTKDSLPVFKKRLLQEIRKRSNENGRGRR